MNKGGIKGTRNRDELEKQLERAGDALRTVWQILQNLPPYRGRGHESSYFRAGWSRVCDHYDTFMADYREQDELEAADAAGNLEDLENRWTPPEA